MKKILLGAAAILLASTAVPAMARDYYDNGNGYYDNGYNSNGYNNGYGPGYNNGYGYNGYGYNNGYNDRYGYNDCRRRYYSGENCNYWNSQYDGERGYGYHHRHYRSDGLFFGFGF